MRDLYSEKYKTLMKRKEDTQKMERFLNFREKINYFNLNNYLK